MEYSIEWNNKTWVFVLIALALKFYMMNSIFINIGTSKFVMLHIEIVYAISYALCKLSGLCHSIPFHNWYR